MIACPCVASEDTVTTHDVKMSASHGMLDQKISKGGRAPIYLASEKAPAGEKDPS